MRQIYRRMASYGLVILMGIGLLASTASADSLTDARNAGYIGERPDGYVAIVDNNAPGSVRELVDQINAQRYAAYQNVSNQTGAPVDQVGIVAAQRIYSDVPPGTYLLSQSGSWYQK